MLAFACVSINCAHISTTEEDLLRLFATELYNDFLPYERQQSCIHPIAVSIKPS